MVSFPYLHQVRENASVLLLDKQTSLIAGVWLLFASLLSTSFAFRFPTFAQVQKSHFHPQPPPLTTATTPVPPSPFFSQECLSCHKWNGLQSQYLSRLCVKLSAISALTVPPQQITRSSDAHWNSSACVPPPASFFLQCSCRLIMQFVHPVSVGVC